MDEEAMAMRHIMRSQAAFAGMEVLTYCFLANHFHIFVRLDPKEAESFDDAELVTRFTLWYNRERGTVGKFWAERFRSVVVEADTEAQRMAAYIDLNPVRAGLVKDAPDYAFSGFGEACAGGSAARRGARESRASRLGRENGTSATGRCSISATTSERRTRCRLPMGFPCIRRILEVARESLPKKTSLSEGTQSTRGKRIFMTGAADGTLHALLTKARACSGTSKTKIITPATPPSMMAPIEKFPITPLSLPCLHRHSPGGERHVD
ncbi:MAG: transposase [Opitutales bacterium]|nr:transposase [Opitutales bacterium]